MILKNPTLSFFSRNRIRVLLYSMGICCVLALLAAAITIRFNFSGSYEGLYLLSGADEHLFELKDEILLGEYQRTIMKVEFSNYLHPFMKKMDRPVSHPHLEYAWQEQNGDGYVMSYFPGGEKFMTAFGRFLDSRGASPDGLFLGGGLPYAKYKDEGLVPNETGMAYYDGRNWIHLWCNANEALIVERETFFPSQWEFLGSKVIFSNEHQLIIRSSHRVMTSTGPLRIDRFAFFRAGDTFFMLMIRIRNVGPLPIVYQYIYGDEPWVGNYGTSVGDVGWTRDGLRYYEGPIDLGRHSFAGMADYGNRAIPEEREALFSSRANFIQWLGEIRPNIAYFSNTIGSYAAEKSRVPLASPDNRVLMLEWGPRELQPTQSEIIMLAIGMAGMDREQGLPLKPQLQLNREDLDLVITSND